MQVHGPEHPLMMTGAPNSLLHQKEGAQGEEEEEGGGSGGRGGRSKKGRIDKKSDARRGRSHLSNSVTGVGCEE